MHCMSTTYVWKKYAWGDEVGTFIESIKFFKVRINCKNLKAKLLYYYVFV